MLSKLNDVNIEDALKTDAGIVVNGNKTFNYVIVQFKGCYDVYLYHDDSDTLVKGTSKYLADAKDKAVYEIEKIK